MILSIEFVAFYLLVWASQVLVLPPKPNSPLLLLFCLLLLRLLLNLYNLHPSLLLLLLLRPLLLHQYSCSISPYLLFFVVPSLSGLVLSSTRASPSYPSATGIEIESIKSDLQQSTCYRCQLPALTTTRSSKYCSDCTTANISLYTLQLQQTTSS